MDRPSTMFRCLIFIITLSFVVQMVVLGENVASVCRNEFCHATSTELLLNANFTVRPCDDYFSHTCGLYMLQKDIPPNQLSYDYAQIVTKKTRKRLRQLLELPIKPDDSRLIRDAKNLYKTCMDTEKINEIGYEVFQYYMNITGDWPMIRDTEARDVEEKPWDVAHNYFKRLTGVGSLLDLRVYAHKYTRNVPMLHLDQPRFLFGTFSPKMTIKQQNYYKEFIKDLALLFIEARHSRVSEAALEQDISDVMSFRRSLARIMLWGDDVRQIAGSFGTFTLDDFQVWSDMNDNSVTENSRVNWTKVVLTSFLFDLEPLRSSQKVIAKNPTYMYNLGSVLGSTPYRTILNHIQLHFLESYIHYAPTAVREKARLLHERMTGLPGLAETDRWKFCLTEHPLQHVLGKWYSDVILTPTARNLVRTMAETIRLTLQRKICFSPWIDKPTKTKAILKLNKLQIIVGYPDWYDLPQSLEHEHQTEGQEALGIALSYAQNEYRMETMSLRAVPPRTKYHVYPTDRTVVYMVEKNILQINSAMIQWPYFNERLPENINYATLGVMIGKEMIHAIDTIGIRFDENGKPEDWWGDTLPMYKQKLLCIVSRHFTLVQRTPDPFSNQIANTLAIRLVADAYLSKFPDELRQQPPHLPGLTNLDDMEAYFLAAASFTCEKVDPKYLKTLKEMDSYTSIATRINVPMKLSSQFNEAYKCYPYSIMNPPDKCNVWEES